MAGNFPDWLDGPPDFDRADPMTPLHDALRSFYVGKHSDRDGNHVADQTDRDNYLSQLQSEAFRNSTADDWTTDEDLAEMEERGEIRRAR